MKKTVSLLMALSLALAATFVAFADSNTIYSDTSVMVYGPLNAYTALGDAAWVSPVPAVVTWKHPSWPILSPASWISNTYYIDGNVAGDTWRLFRKTVELCEGAYDISGSINATSDNAEEVYVNGNKVGFDGEIQGPFVDNAEWSTINSYYYVAEANTLTFDFIVRNYAGSSSATSNPTGLIFNATVNYECNQPPVADPNGPYLGAVNTAIAFDGTGSSDPDGDSLNYAWNFGDGNTSVGVAPTHSYAVAGIYDVCLTVSDGHVDSPNACTYAIVYDPTGGFVTGGGWFDSPAGAVAPAENIVYFNGFETDIDGWFTPSRVISGTNGIPSASGGYHAEAIAGNYTRWGGYNSVFPAGGFITSMAVYLNMNAGYANDTRFDWSSAINGPSGEHRRDFVFTGGFYNDATGPGAGQHRFVFSASNNTPGWPKNPDRDPFAVTTTGWYTLQHYFYDSGVGVLAVDMTILDAAGNELHRWTISDPTDVIGTTVGGNRYGWLVTNGFPFLAIDNSVRQEFSDITGRATFGFVSKYKKGATVPEGNTEFQFKAGNLNFSSTNYEWLVVNQAGANAQFKGYGTINGTGNYGFMLWATDGAPDKFRIKIWDVETEAVIYDNGTDQAIGGGSIVVHKK
ncbi:MAG TPA: PKD domain-containing protein [Anaerolineales bacterium]|nr:PKD domain-containing protein [Anaerolineales bacterium]